MNIIDLGVLVLVALCALAGYRKGLIRTVYRLASFFIAMLLANLLYPFVAGILQQTPLYNAIQDSLKAALNMEAFAENYTTDVQTEIIDSLRLPNQFRDLLHNHFEPNVHGILKVDTIEEYVSAFFANIAINGIAIILVFMIVLIILSIVGVALDIVGSLPVISTFNNFGGLAFGILLGAVISWVVIVALAMISASSVSEEVYDVLQNSFIASRLLEWMLPSLTSV